MEENIGLSWLKYWAGNMDLEVRDYSGRYMYGDICPGVTVASAFGAYHQMVYDLVSDESGDYPAVEVLDALGKPQLDSMGMDQILYFPDCEMAEDENTEE